MWCKNELNNHTNNKFNKSYNLKLGLKEGYYSLFTSSYKIQEHELTNKLKTTILNACSSIKTNIDNKCKEPHFHKLILDLQENQNYIAYNDIEENIKRYFW